MDFKLLTGDKDILKTYEERHAYLMEFSAPYRNHIKGALFSKRVWKAFICPILMNTPIMTKADIERVVMDHTIDPNTINDGDYIDPDGFIHYSDGTSDWDNLIQPEEDPIRYDFDTYDAIDFELKTKTD